MYKINSKMFFSSLIFGSSSYIWINNFPFADMFFIGAGGGSQSRVVLHSGKYGICILRSDIFVLLASYAAKIGSLLTMFWDNL